MTRSSDFKRAVRARMTKTGERYTTARAHLLARHEGSWADDSGTYPFRPGVCRDTAAFVNGLQASGVLLPTGGAPIREALLTGLAGGIGFLYIVFEYRDTPPLISMLTRFDSAADRFAPAALERLGLEIQHATTSSANKARKDLEAALDANRPAFCLVDALALTQTNDGPPRGGGVPTWVTVAGRDGEHLLVDVGAMEPLRLTPEAFARARAAFSKGKHHLITVQGQVQLPNLQTGLHAAIADCAERYTTSPYKGFASNFGFAGMEKWAQMLVDQRNKKGWPTLFPDGAGACTALRRVYQGVQYEMTPPNAGRGFYADFLREASSITGHAPYQNAAQAFDQAALAWHRLAQTIAECALPAVQTGCSMLDDYAQYLDEQSPESARLGPVPDPSVPPDADALDRAAILEIYSQLAERVQEVTAQERAAHAALLQAQEVLA